MPKDTFLFVQYRCGKQSAQDIKLANSDARSHAAAVSRQRRDNKTRNSSSSGINPLNGTPVLGSFQITSNGQHGDDDDVSPASPSSVLPTGTSRAQRRQNMRAMQFSWRAGTGTPIARIPGGHRSDPFACIPSGAFAQDVTDYYTQIIIPVNRPIYDIFDVTNVYSSYYLELLQNDDYRPAGLAMVGALMQKVTRGNQPSDEVKTNHAQALTRLYEKCGEDRFATDDNTIVTVLALANLARFLGDSYAYERHRKSMDKMIAARGGLNQLGHTGLAKCLLMQWDSFWVFETEGQSLFPNSRPPHYPLFPAFPLNEDLKDVYAKLPIGFQTLIMKGKISIDVLAILGRAADAASSGGAVFTGANAHLQARRHHDFVEACPCLGMPDSDEINIAKQICLALLLYCANAFTDARSSTALYHASRVELSRLLLREQPLVSPSPEAECVFWTAVVCVDSWRQGDHGSVLSRQGLDLLPVLKKLASKYNPDLVVRKFFSSSELLSACARYIEMASWSKPS